MDRNAAALTRPRRAAPRAVAWIATLAAAPLIAGVALGLLVNAHAAITAVGIYFVGLLMWVALRAMGGRRPATRSAQLVLALGVVTAMVTDNMAISLTLCMLGLSGVILAIASAPSPSVESASK